MAEPELNGLIFDIQGFSVHDGPGCRTMVFLSGCPLRCSWCANPEGLSPRPQLLYRSTQCRATHHRCAKACPSGAISIREDHNPPLKIDRINCRTCTQMPCVEACLSQALAGSGRTYSVSELMAILKRDSDYWGEGGGVTLSGGEPLLQGSFTTAVLRECRRSYLHTALETSAYCPQATLEQTLPWLDWLFIDLKHMDNAEHRTGTGTDNQPILANIEVVARSNWPGRVVIRLPVVPGFNDSSENLKATADFVARLGLREVQLMPFHRLGATKYTQLGLDYAYSDVETVPEERLREHAEVFTGKDLRCWIGAETPF